MKFIVSKKLIDNRALYVSVLWMVIFLILALMLNFVAKSIDSGITPELWINHILGNEAEFIEPLTMKDLLLTLHTELFELILLFILISALLMRTSRSKKLKMALLLSGVMTLLLYPVGLLASLTCGSFAIILAWGGFVLFHLLMIGSALDILILLLRKRF
ncbi:MAG: hypothetical protein PHV62_01690 [Sulfuricurvum sp.]|nr:hypothetical protein [Sulfuricurvum sp.]